MLLLGDAIQQRVKQLYKKKICRIWNFIPTASITLKRGGAVVIVVALWGWETCESGRQSSLDPQIPHNVILSFVLNRGCFGAKDIISCCFTWGIFHWPESPCHSIPNQVTVWLGVSDDFSGLMVNPNLSILFVTSLVAWQRRPGKKTRSRNRRGMQSTVFDEHELEPVCTLLLCRKLLELCKGQIGLTGRNIVGPCSWTLGIFVDTALCWDAA